MTALARQPDAPLPPALRPPTRPAIVETVAPAGHTADVERRLQIVERAAAIAAVYGGDAAMGRAFCALVVFSGHEVTLKNLLAAVPKNGLRPRAADLCAAMAHLDFHAKRVRFSKQRWRRAPVPMVVEGEHGPVALCPTADGGLAFGGAAEPGAVAEAGLEGRPGWEFRLDDADDPLSESARRHTQHSWMRALLARFPRALGGLALTGLVLTVTGLLLPLAVTFFFTEIRTAATPAGLVGMLAGIALIVLIEAIALTGRSNLIVWLAHRLDYLVNTASFQRILKISPALSERASPTAQAARLRSFESIRDFLSGPTFASLADLPVAVFSLVVVAAIAPAVGGVLAAAVVGFVAVFVTAWRRSLRFTSMAAEEATEVQRLAIETFDKLQAIRDGGLQDVWRRRIAEMAARDQGAQTRLRMTGLTAEAAASVIFTVAIVGQLAVGALEVWAGGVSGPKLLALTILGTRILAPFNTLCLSVLRFEQIRRGIDQINRLMDVGAESQGRDLYKLGAVSGRVSFVNVGFRGGDTRPVFAGLDLDVQPGEVIGIFGGNGTGKTTLFRMLLGMAEIPFGTVRIDGVDLRQLPLEELRRRISYLPQQPRLYPGTLRQNLAFANPLASAADLDEVLASVELTAAVAALPRGLDTRIDADDEAMFLPDFRARFALARALLVNSRLLLIDEVPNSILDAGLGDILRRLIIQSRGRRTVMFVSHRSDFLSVADRVVVLRYGGAPAIVQPNAFLEKRA
jgi:ABC-type bacteriocin/lantibiotic exporter with double-glycine peptidase domain